MGGERVYIFIMYVFDTEKVQLESTLLNGEDTECAAVVDVSGAVSVPAEQPRLSQ
jgi:hypothetical protein